MQQELRGLVETLVSSRSPLFAPPTRESKPAFDLVLRAIRSRIEDGRHEEARETLRALALPGLDYTSARSLFGAYRALARKSPPQGRELRVAVLGGFTTVQLADFIELHLFARGLDPVIYEADYGVLQLETLDPSSRLFAFRPDIVYVGVTWRDVTRLPQIGDPDGEVAALAEAEVDDWHRVWERIHAGTRAHVIQDNFSCPAWRQLSNLERSVPSSVTSFLNRLNPALQERAPTYVTIHDVDDLASAVGRRSWNDERFFHQAKLPCAPEHLVEYGHSVASLMAAHLGSVRKCLVLDLDNTLWGGVVGDDGLEGIRVGQGDAQAEAYQAFQRYVLGLHRRGVILAICSANDEHAARQPFEQHPGMVLSLEDISCFVANWNDKASNLRAIATELDIGLDSMVFFDDDPAQRSLVRRMLPEVAVPEVGDDPSDYVRILGGYRYFQAVALSEEDLKRGELYQANARRRRFRESTETLEGFLESLEMRARLAPVGPANLERSTQLINKTNQFNLTLRRYSLAEVGDMCSSPQWLSATVSITDRFGDNGLISVVLGRVEGKRLSVDVWVMSCRVLRRGVERFLMNHLLRLARERGVELIHATYIPGPKNSQVADLCASLGFERVSGGDGGETHWELVVAEHDTPLPTCVREEETLRG